MPAKKTGPTAAGGGSTRDRMVEAAARLLQRDGYAATSWRGIVDEAGTPWGSAYHHFPGGKEQLAVAALGLGSQLVVDLIERALRDEDTVPEAVRRCFALSARNMMDSQFRTGCPVATVALETTPASATLTAACSSSFGRWQRILAAAIQDAGATPERAAELATLVIATLEGSLLLARVSQDVEPLTIAGAAMARLLADELA